jgi:hypothetical protein
MGQLLALLVLCASVVALAEQQDGRMAFLLRQLSSAKDPRARAQAALLLGASKDTSVEAPLCNALSDDSPLVRLAVVRSLGKLGTTRSRDCLSRRPDVDANVEAERKQALSVAPPRQAKSSLYVALTTSSELSGADAEKTVRATRTELEEGLKSLGGVVAAEKETSAQATAKIRSQGLKGYSLRVRLSSAAAGALTLNLMCFTYPSEALLGEVSVTASGAPPMALAKALVPRVLEEASDTCNWSH